jgi:diguanylate cyclase (GGDEF)-like protein/putative nucleotidyltransferase with HDIG domain
MSAALAVFVLHAGWHFGGDVGDQMIGRWLNAALGVAPAAYCIWRAYVRRHERLPCLLLGLGAAAWGIGNLYFLAAFYRSANVPFPSLADAGYLSLYPFMYAGLLLLMRTSTTGFRRVLWLDGLIGGLAVASLATAFVFQAVLHSVGGPPAAVATNLAYPLGDAVLIALVVLVVGASGWRPGREWLMLGLGLGVFFLGDSVYLVQTSHGTYVAGNLPDATWLIGLLLVAFAAATVPATARRRVSADRTIVVIMPIVFLLAMVGLEAWDHLHPLNTLAIVLASLTLLAAAARLTLTLAENLSMLRQSRRDAMTDQLTQLGNRRQLLEDLASALEEPRDRLLVLLDLNGFKNYNDNFGHLAGDTLLARLGTSLSVAFEGHGHAYRLGGDEFCVLVELADSEPASLIEAAASALQEHGEGFKVTASYGTAVIPREASRVSDALRLVDRRMYADKQRDRISAQEQSRSVLLSVLAERQPDLCSHMARVADLAARVATRLGLPIESVQDVRTAAALHDIGKVAIPDSILEKSGPLDRTEVAFMRQHTITGERIMLSTPALEVPAKIVRSSHERVDGAGYPDGLAGEEIPLGSRIVFACDAFDAMTSTRPHSSALTLHAAIAELQSRAGSQFDLKVVDALLAEIAEHGLNVDSSDAVTVARVALA